MKRIAIIPIDNRPVCYELVKLIGELDSDNEILLPPIDSLGDLKKNADIEALLNWLENIEQADNIIVSLDTVAYGGLIPSRRSIDNFEIIKNRLDKLFDILCRKNIKVYAFSSIMRISNNNINEEEKEYWSDYGKSIFKYSYDLHESELTGKVFKHSIPDKILQDYLNTRKRNFEINKYYITLKKQGLIDTLVFAKDDCAKYGLNVKEANKLENLAQNDENILVKTGADEIPISLLSRALNKKSGIKIAPVYMNPDSIDKISKYEDISVKKSVESQIEISGGIVSSVNECDLILYVNNFLNEQGELVMNINEPLFDSELKINNKPFFFADILNANGSDNNFVKQVFNYVQNDNFYGYAAWNTTGNTLGSSIGTALTYFNANNKNMQKFKKLQSIRFLDDWAYQANIRKNIRDNASNLSSEKLKTLMKPYEDIVFNLFDLHYQDVCYSFPWNRFFEIRIKI